ncbi:hypothetical protein CVCC1112_3551 [Paenarthrobacter nicotinovorans]|nr:hypothetical protein CVCC1112_3551 [Paenarthrobacter nicotinovorans]
MRHSGHALKQPRRKLQPFQRGSQPMVEIRRTHNSGSFNAAHREQCGIAVPEGCIPCQVEPLFVSVLHSCGDCTHRCKPKTLTMQVKTPSRIFGTRFHA